MRGFLPKMPDCNSGGVLVVGAERTGVDFIWKQRAQHIAFNHVVQLRM